MLSLDVHCAMRVCMFVVILCADVVNIFYVYLIF